MNERIPRVTNLASFRRFLAEPGATVQLTRHDRVNKHAAKPGMFDPRIVLKLQTNAVKLSNESWLDWRNGVKRWQFEGDNMTVPLDPERNPDLVMVYHLSFAS
jgi:hypothetical protein